MTQSVRAAALAAVTLLAAVAAAARADDGSWLDAKSAQDWNLPGVAIPAPPRMQIDDGNRRRCGFSIRRESTPQDRQVRAAGWTLFGPFRLFNGTSIVGGLTSFDGMCRPLGYQEFVFAGERFAGTLSPSASDSRTDGALDRSYLYAADNIVAEFRRYKPGDPLCCPSGTSTVTYGLDTSPANGAVLRVKTVSTSANAPR